MTRVALIFGGRSPEHEVSIVSARNVFLQLQNAGFETIAVGVDRTGTWHIGAEAFRILCNPPAEKPSQKTDYEGLLKLILERVDVVFPLIHGVSGEDGCLQGLCELLDIAYVGGDVLNMSLTWDKLATRTLLRQNNVPQPEFLALFRDQYEADISISRIEATLDYPIFIKPSRTGSSIGVSRANNRKALVAAVELAFQYDYRIIAEQGLDAREIEIAGVGGSDPFLSVPALIIPENDFYDFEEKYIKSTTRFVIPAEIEETQLKALNRIAGRAWSLLNCYGMSRIDFLVTSDNVYLNEINTVPGFTPISMYPALLKKSGMGPEALMRRLVELALERKEHLARRDRFDSHLDWYKGGSGD